METEEREEGGEEEKEEGKTFVLNPTHGTEEEFCRGIDLLNENVCSLCAAHSVFIKETERHLILQNLHSLIQHLLSV